MTIAVHIVKTMTNFKPQKDFPLLDRYKKRFAVTENTIFAYDDTIYCDEELPHHLIIHEETHLKQQKKVGLNEWVEKYLTDTNFRLRQEVEAYQNQLNSIRPGPVRVAIKQKIIKDLSSALYGNIITQTEARQRLK